MNPSGQFKYKPESAPDAFPGWQVLDPASIPRIRFVYGGIYAAGYLTVTFAAPKTGKSLLGMAEGIDAATGRGFLTGRETEPQRVLYYNAEDDQAVMNARTMAVLQEHGIPQSEIVGRFFPVSGVSDDRSLVLIKGEKNEIQEPAFAFLADFFRTEGITLAVFDPLQDLSQSPETNEAFRALGARIRRLANETGVAIGMVHHTRKPSAGVQISLDDGRGGSALRGVARFNRLLAPMTEAEGAQAGVDDFRHYFRIAEAESNLAPPSSDRNQWFEKTGVEIGNGAAYPTIRKWTWPEAFTGVTVNDACRVRALISERAERDEPTRENVQAKDWAGHIVAEVLSLDLNKRADKARVVAMLRKWIETGVLRVERLAHGPKRKEADFIFPGSNNPAEEAQ
ncbi:AAA family ATPase [Tabrizicola sp.]|uniref:AAA family ATPase n=1 Tax=Tabrizicola sp. TaxID=2005166 RepID=UPI001A5879A5|nr:AAA family ATPase [Tabrizicola sp.]MBL9062748.1 AAA family ATPase [Tabrizicola sp.]